MTQTKIQRFRENLNDRVRDWGNSKDIKFSNDLGTREFGFGDMLTQKTNFETYLSALGMASPIFFWYSCGQNIAPVTSIDQTIAKLICATVVSAQFYPVSLVQSYLGYKSGKR